MDAHLSFEVLNDVHVNKYIENSSSFYQDFQFTIRNELSAELIVCLTWRDMWCSGCHICFSSLPPMLGCGFQSRLGLEFLVFVCAIF